jgi:hypothetical protein
VPGLSLPSKGTSKYAGAEWERESISKFKANALDRLVAAGKIREMDRERVTFVVWTIIHPPERPDDALPEHAVGRA